MQRLNIPLHRHSKITRRHSRRVISLLIGTSLLCGCLFLWTSKTILTKDTLTVAAPENTVAALHFSPNQKTWEQTEAFLHNIPLISDRGITIQDVKTYIYGGFSLFIQEDGTTSLAIRAKKEQVPESFLDTHQITIQEVDTSTLLLSSSLIPISGLKEPEQVKKSLFKFGAKKIATLTVKQNDIFIQGPIFTTKNEAFIHLPTQEIAPIPLEAVPSSTFAVMSTPAWTNNESLLSNSVLSFLESDNAINFSDFVSALSSNGFLLLAQEENQNSFLVKILDPSLSKEGIVSMLRTSAAILSAKTQDWTLEDGDIVEEIVSDGSAISIEEIVLSGRSVTRIPTTDATYLYYASFNDETYITNDEGLLQFVVNETTSETETLALPKETSIFINTNDLSQNVELISNHLQSHQLTHWLFGFSELSFYNSFRKTVVYLRK